MQLSNGTNRLLETLDALSQGRLTRRDDLGLLLELAKLHNQEDVLADLSFLAKFLARTYNIMKRIGKDGTGYTELSREFSNNVEKARGLLQSLLKSAPDEVTKRLTFTYLSMTHEALEHLLALFYDLSWYKNWLLDQGRNP